MAALEDQVLGTDSDPQADPVLQEALATKPSALVTGDQSALSPENRIGRYQAPSQQTTQQSDKPPPVITNLAQLAHVMKGLAGVPDELKTHLLSQWTGIPLTSAKVQQLQNTIIAAQAKFNAGAPDRAAKQVQHLKEYKERNATTQAHLEMGHQAALRNIQGAMAKAQHNMSPQSGNMPGTPQYQQAYETYIELNKQYKKMTGIDLAAKVEEGVKAAGKETQPAANQSGIKVTKIEEGK